MAGGKADGAPFVGGDDMGVGPGVGQARTEILKKGIRNAGEEVDAGIGKTLEKVIAANHGKSIGEKHISR